MARRIDPTIGHYDAVIFLAIRSAGNEGCDLTGVIGRCDWWNRDFPTAKELEGGLNRLMAAGLVEMRRGRFCVPVKVAREFDALRKRLRRGRWMMAERFIAGRALKAVPRRVAVSAARHREAYAEYRRRFARAVRQAPLSARDRTAILEGMRK